MTNIIHRKSLLFSAVIGLALAASPGVSMAQRFGHGGGGGGGFHPAPAPAFRPAAPAPRMAAPAPRQEVARPEAPRPEVEHATINGGARNFGNHDYSRPAPAVRENVHENVHENVNVNVHANIGYHGGTNVYHTGGYRGVHPYYYHPYRPYYWGPHWHPVGFFRGALASDAIWFNFNNQRYWYDDGCYYLPSNGGYSVVPAPIGAIVGALPD